jgi:phosphoribosylanthranilate isomerase
VRTRIKICGLTRRDDAMGAAEWGADALGFVFAERSKRRADPEVVAAFAGEIAPFVTRVGVFQNQPIDKVRRVMRLCRLHVAQLHGDEDERYIAELGLPVLKAVGLGSAEDVEKLSAFPSQGAFLLDSGAGGTGRPFEWPWALAAMRYGRIVLAGGLTPANVADAMRRVRPWAVDTASGVEKSPGIKDSKKVREFIRRVRETDREQDGASHHA